MMPEGREGTQGPGSVDAPISETSASANAMTRWEMWTPHGKADVDALVASIAANGAQTRCSDLTSVAGSITSTSGRLSSPLVATLKIVMLSGSCVVIIGKLNEQRGHLRSHPEVRRDDVQ